MTELHQYTTLIEAQLLDGEEKISDTITVTYADGVLGGVTADNVVEVVKALINETDLANLSTGGAIAATYANGVLTIAYTHNLTTATANTTWTIGTAA